jgi:hypothetical protein
MRVSHHRRVLGHLPRPRLEAGRAFASAPRAARWPPDGRGGDIADGDRWFDLNTKQVVQDDKAGKAADRLGPCSSREAAEHALETVQQRNESADTWDDD